MKRISIILIMACWCGLAPAQTSTPTNTPTVTNTPTPTKTPTITPSPTPTRNCPYSESTTGDFINVCAQRLNVQIATTVYDASVTSNLDVGNTASIPTLYTDYITSSSSFIRCNKKLVFGGDLFAANSFTHQNFEDVNAALEITSASGTITTLNSTTQTTSDLTVSSEINAASGAVSGTLSLTGSGNIACATNAFRFVVSGEEIAGYALWDATGGANAGIAMSQVYSGSTTIPICIPTLLNNSQVVLTGAWIWIKDNAVGANIATTRILKSTAGGSISIEYENTNTTDLGVFGGTGEHNRDLVISDIEMSTTSGDHYYINLDLANINGWNQIGVRAIEYTGYTITQ